MTREEKLKLYNEAKEAYYNGEEIMSDQEFDKLEKELGLENKSYVGTHHQKSYTIKHPYLMGSLSKVQIVKDNKGVVDYDKFADAVNSYLKKSRKYGEQVWYCDITPKFDGCSFEVVIDWKAICCPYLPEEMVSMVRILKTGLNTNGTDGLLLERWVNIWQHWMATSRCFSIDLSLEVNVLLIRISLIANTQKILLYQGLSFRVLLIRIGKIHQNNMNAAKICLGYAMITERFMRMVQS